MGSGLKVLAEVGSVEVARNSMGESISEGLSEEKEKTVVGAQLVPFVLLVSEGMTGLGNRGDQGAREVEEAVGEGGVLGVLED